MGDPISKKVSWVAFEKKNASYTCKSKRNQFSNSASYIILLCLKIHLWWGQNYTPITILSNKYCGIWWLPQSRTSRESMITWLTHANSKPWMLVGDCILSSLVHTWTCERWFDSFQSRANREPMITQSTHATVNTHERWFLSYEGTVYSRVTLVPCRTWESDRFHLTITISKGNCSSNSSEWIRACISALLNRSELKLSGASSSKLFFRIL